MNHSTDILSLSGQLCLQKQKIVIHIINSNSDKNSQSKHIFRMKTISFISLFLFLFVAVSCNQPQRDSEWIQLFNGEDLTGWTPKIRGFEAGYNFANTFRVEDGLLKVRYCPVAYERFQYRFGHIFFEQPFSHYILRVTYRIVGNQVPGAPGWAYRNSGIMIHGQTPESMTLNQDFPTSIEVQLLGRSARYQRRTTANLCLPGTRVVINDALSTQHCINSTLEAPLYDEWMTIELEVRGNEVIRHIHNGEVVMEYFQPQLNRNHHYFAKLYALNGNDVMLHGGTISLQSEGHPIDFKVVEIKVLEP